MRVTRSPLTVLSRRGLLLLTAGLAASLVLSDKVELVQGDTVSAQTTITRADVARVCVAALKYPAARNRTFEISAQAGPPVTDWRTKFAALKPAP
ncbi:MAG: hypothetical protein EXR82_06995 [Gammaproteobacteria bacterium]|nr:hypothetical protein [Gammaproteobacteria bacterium]